MRVEKGGLASVDGIWYVIVAVHFSKGVAGFDCLCDHANNIHFWDFKDAQYFASLKEIHDHSYGQGSDAFKALVNKRSIPYDVITAVLSGCEDDRFDHWHKELK